MDYQDLLGSAYTTRPPFVHEYNDTELSSSTEDYEIYYDCLPEVLAGGQGQVQPQGQIVESAGSRQTSMDSTQSCEDDSPDRCERLSTEQQQVESDGNSTQLKLLPVETGPYSENGQQDDSTHIATGVACSLSSTASAEGQATKVGNNSQMEDRVQTDRRQTNNSIAGSRLKARRRIRLTRPRQRFSRLRRRPTVKTSEAGRSEGSSSTNDMSERELVYSSDGLADTLSDDVATVRMVVTRQQQQSGGAVSEDEAQARASTPEFVASPMQDRVQTDRTACSRLSAAEFPSTDYPIHWDETPAQQRYRCPVDDEVEFNMAGYHGSGSQLSQQMQELMGIVRQTVDSQLEQKRRLDDLIDHTRERQRQYRHCAEPTSSDFMDLPHRRQQLQRCHYTVGAPAESTQLKRETNLGFSDSEDGRNKPLPASYQRHAQRPTRVTFERREDSSTDDDRPRRRAFERRPQDINPGTYDAVSYTHLTLPTNREV